jgi:hypothetical protein
MAVLASAGSAAAQDCFPAKNSNEAEMFAIFSVPLAFGPGGGGDRLAPGKVQLGIEVAGLPEVDSVTATPLTCRPGKEAENTDLLPVLPRPRLAIGLPGAFALEISWIPPVRVAGVEANLFGFSLGRSFQAGRSVALVLRGHATVGSIRAPITCDEDALENPASECYEGQLSEDSYRPNIFGADATLAWGGSRVRPYLGVGYNALRPRFQVHFINSAGDLDSNRIAVDLSRIVTFAGLTWAPGANSTISGEVYLAPRDALTARVIIRQTVVSF